MLFKVDEVDLHEVNIVVVERHGRPGIPYAVLRAIRVRGQIPDDALLAFTLNAYLLPLESLQFL